MLLLLQQNLGFAWGSAGLVTVPDVVGQTQASATTDIEAVGLVVSVTTANSSVIAAGLVISQSPSGGTDVSPGSTVAIVVSLGDATQPSGGFYFGYDRILHERIKRKKELEEAEEAAQNLTDKVDAEIAKLLHEQQRKDEERDNLARIQKLIAQYPQEKLNIERVDRALELAKQKQTLASYEALQREFLRAQEDEDFMVLTLLAMID